MFGAGVGPDKRDSLLPFAVTWRHSRKLWRHHHRVENANTVVCRLGTGSEPPAMPADVSARAVRGRRAPLACDAVSNRRVRRCLLGSGRLSPMTIRKIKFGSVCAFNTGRHIVWKNKTVLSFVLGDIKTHRGL